MHTRAVTDAEREWLDALGPELMAALVERLRADGWPERTVLGLVGWLSVKAIGLVDETSSATRAKYRAMLRDLGSPRIIML